MRSIQIRAFWDEEAHVWVTVDSAAVPGLVAEAPTLDQLLSKLRILVPELLEENMAHDFDFAGPNTLALTAVEPLQVANHH